MSFEATETDLVQWRKSHGVQLGYGANILSVQKAGLGFDITDDWAMTIDGAVAELKLRTVESKIGALVEDYFTDVNSNYISLGIRYKIGKHKAREFVNQGISWIDARVSDMRVQAERVSF